MSPQQADLVATKGVGGGAPKASFMQNLQRMVRLNIRDYGMYIALFVIMAFFTWRTNGLFISSRNIANLLNQTGYIAVLAVGMTLVIVIRHIDLSVGFLSGFLAAIATIGYDLLPPALVCGHTAGNGDAELWQDRSPPSWWRRWGFQPLSPRWAAGCGTEGYCCLYWRRRARSLLRTTPSTR